MYAIIELRLVFFLKIRFILDRGVLFRFDEKKSVSKTLYIYIFVYNSGGSVCFPPKFATL